MSTNDVPGAEPRNQDKLGIGCWAEAQDGSLLLVEGIDDEKVIYSIFNMAPSKLDPPQPAVEYRDAMPIKGFEKQFSYSKSKKPLGGLWTWHDKTPFPWERIIKEGMPDGVRYSSVEDQLNAAMQVVRARKLLGQGLPVAARPWMNQVKDKSSKIIDKIQRAISELRA